MNSIVRAPEETFTTVVFGTLVDTRDGCLLGEPNRRRPFRPGPAWRRCRAVPCPARGMSGFWTRQVLFVSFSSKAHSRRNKKQGKEFVKITKPVFDLRWTWA